MDDFPVEPDNYTRAGACGLMPSQALSILPLGPSICPAAQRLWQKADTL